MAGLTESQSKPADILTSAASPGRRAALDLGITSPNSTTAAAAAGDAVAAMHQRKHQRYAADAPVLREANVVYMPLIWSADGRPHPQVGRAMQYAARMAGHSDSDQPAGHALFLKRWRHEIAVALCRRRAAIARAVLPPPPHAWGRVSPSSEDDDDTQCPLEEDSTYDFAEDADSDWDLVV